jgi:hypothetical protein
VVLVYQESALDPIAKSARWEPLPPVANQAVWTDDFSSVLNVISTRMFDWEQ